MQGDQRTTFGVQKLHRHILAQFAVAFLQPESNKQTKKSIIITHSQIEIATIFTHHTFADDGAVLHPARRIRHHIQQIIVHFGHNQIVQNAAIRIGEHRQCARIVGQTADVGGANALKTFDGIFATDICLQHVRHIEYGRMLSCMQMRCGNAEVSVLHRQQVASKIDHFAFVRHMQVVQ